MTSGNFFWLCLLAVIFIGWSYEEVVTDLAVKNASKSLDSIENILNLEGNFSTLDEATRSFNVTDNSDFGNKTVDGPSESHGVTIVSWKWNYVKKPFILVVFFLVIAVFKLGYHHTTYIQKVLPESCFLILIGALFGLAFISDSTHESVKFLEFNSETFFFILLPPIILESAYALKDREFIEHLGTIIVYAVVGTVLNIVLITLCHQFLISIGAYGVFNLSILDVIVFSSLIAAVDPVAVLAVFQNLGVNKMLYFMVFGESLLNDAVTIVCYNLANEFKKLPDISATDLLLGIVVFFYVSFGGLLIGFVCGFASTFVTKYTAQVQIVEPVFLYGSSYLAYIGSEMFHFSGIISLITCGLFQGHYSHDNVSYKTWSSVQYLTKVLSSCSESLIFIILGVMIVNKREWFWQDWHPFFSVSSVIICFVVRFAVTFSLTYIVNKFTGGVRYISYRNQVIMAYGGLRGAISFSLAFMIKSSAETKNTILAATYIVILFTVFVQGSTIEMLVKAFNISLAKKEDNFRLFREFNNGTIEHLSQGIEDLCGYKNYNWAHWLRALSKKYIRPIIQKNYAEKGRKEQKLVNLERMISMRDAINRTSSQSSFNRQQTISAMAESGISMDLVDVENYNHGPSNAELEKRTEELTRDVSSIRQLMNNPASYVDRNLTHEKVNETNGEGSSESKFNLMSTMKQKSSKFLEKKKSVRQNATQHGLLHSAIAAVGVNSVSSEQPSTSASHIESDEEEGLKMLDANPENHHLLTINEEAETEL